MVLGRHIVIELRYTDEASLVEKIKKKKKIQKI